MKEIGDIYLCLSPNYRAMFDQITLLSGSFFAVLMEIIRNYSFFILGISIVTAQDLNNTYIMGKSGVGFI